MRYNNQLTSAFVKRREKLREKLLPGSFLVIKSSYHFYGNCDTIAGFLQNSDLFYLTGIEQENVTLIIGSEDNKVKEMLFIMESNPFIEHWEGKKISKEKATEVSGIQKVKFEKEFNTELSSYFFHNQNVYLNITEHYRASLNNIINDANYRFTLKVKEQYPLHNYYRLNPIIASLKTVKDNEEIKVIKEAIRITKDGFLKIKPLIKPGIKEYELEAEFIYEFTRQGSKGFAYTPIIASGKNSCCLHYNKNNKILVKDNVLLLDIGAEYGNYRADVTRTFPVNGRFTKRQAEIYNIVLEALHFSLSNLKAGIFFDKWKEATGLFIQEKLLTIGLLTKKDIEESSKENPAFKKYFTHGLGHYLGIDTHDAGDIRLPIPEGAVITCEPGIYLQKEEIGIRLEEDLLVTKNGYENLTSEIPISLNEIESS